jgi:hypothetical protein
METRIRDAARVLGTHRDAAPLPRSHRRFGRSENTEFPNNPRIGFLSGCIATDAARHLAAHRESSELDGPSRSTNEYETLARSQIIVSLLRKSIILSHMYLLIGAAHFALEIGPR